MRADKHKKKKRWIKIFGFLSILLFVAAGSYVYSIYHSLNNTMVAMNENEARAKSDKREENLSLNKKQPFSVLLLGVDERQGDRGRSDTMIVVTVNPQENSTKMVSIPRDTRTEIIGKDFEDKINHAYAYGGIDMSLDTVEAFLDIPIDYYAKINMEGLEDIVNAVGGVTVQNELNFTYKGKTFTEGTLTLNGEEALLFSRMRKNDPNNDFGRQARQRQIIQAIIKEGASVSSLWNFGDIFKSIGNNVKTNLSLAEMVDIQQNYKSATQNINQRQLEGSGAMISNGEKEIYYYIVAKEEQQIVQQELKKHLNL
ncbi:LCP family glycopolymer transferase [Bacillus sp. 2205SS5-2]|uniref:LCP family glycopolymer transferase n=1 Tax=Bacillus sp. 2205SS5-2 TaxID=3109031 RepID=UPI0030076310